jgi:hypothetical protein
VAWANPNSPNLPDFMLFVYDYMQIDPVYLPNDSPFFGYAFNQAMATVIRAPRLGFDYTLAVYNCGGHILIRITPDQPQRDFFKGKRVEYNLLKLSAGVVAGSSDEGTSETLAVPDAIRQLTIGDLQFMKTPWGREYLTFAQDFGGVFGIS